jgi:hypothetical protein
MPVINLARQCFSSERRNVAYPVVSAQGSTPLLGRTKEHAPSIVIFVTARFSRKNANKSAYTPCSPPQYRYRSYVSRSPVAA